MKADPSLCPGPYPNAVVRDMARDEIALQLRLRQGDEARLLKPLHGFGQAFK